MYPLASIYIQVSFKSRGLGESNLKNELSASTVSDRAGRTASVASKKSNHWGTWIIARARFVGFRRQSDLAKAVGCSAQTLSKWAGMAKPPEQMRRGHDEALARSLKIDRATLFGMWSEIAADDWEERPAPASAALATIDDDELRTEYIRRLTSAAVALHKSLKRAEGADWAALAAELRHVPMQSELPRSGIEAIRLQNAISSSRWRVGRFDPEAHGEEFWAAVPGFTLSESEELSFARLRDRHEQLMKSPDYRAILEIALLRLGSEFDEDPTGKTAVRRYQARMGGKGARGTPEY